MCVEQPEGKHNVLLIAVGFDLFAYGKVSPLAVTSMRADQSLGAFHAKLVEGLDCANAWLSKRGYDVIQPMDEADREFATDDHQQVGWLLCRLKDQKGGFLDDF